MNSLSLRNVGFGLLFSHILQNAQRNNVAKRERGDPSPQKGGGGEEDGKERGCCGDARVPSFAEIRSSGITS